MQGKYNRRMTSSLNTSSDHMIDEFLGDPAGPTMMVFGSLHGNEPAGSAALRRVASGLRAGKYEVNGRIYFFVGNIRALEKGVRFIDGDLNRHWTPENVIRNLPDTAIPPHLSEDKEQAELLTDMIPILRSGANEVYALDLHSTSAEGVPFATVGDTLRNRNFAQQFPITILLGIEEQLEGTLLEYLNNQGVITLGYEGGQHFAESTVEVHEALVWRALANSRILVDTPELDVFNELLEKATGRSKILEVRYRHAINEKDEFEMLPGFNNFDPIKKGQKLAADVNGSVDANETGLILMPLYQKLGEDGFFIGREFVPFWIWVSGVLRKLRLGSLMHLLPGVRRSETDRDVFEIDTTIARFFPLQVFHLLGFRKRRWVGEKLVVSRRKFDTFSPFVKR